MTAIHQLVHTLSYGDAISGEVLALQRCFRAMGFESEIFAIHWHPKYEGLVRDYRSYPAASSDEVILHYSLGSPLSALYRGARGTRTLIYHNLTPAKWFRGVNSRIVQDIEAGLQELPDLCRQTDRLIADSAFNAVELKVLGFDAQVLPLSVDPERWVEPANSGFRSMLAGDPGLHLLHVGRIAPNKCIEDIIKIFYFLHHKIDQNSRLWLVGTDIDTELYAFGLKRLTDELGLFDHVSFLGSRSDGEVRALYEQASVYLCMSEHEGFCLPVIEAMHFGMPVIAFASSALPETVAAGGVLVKEKRHAELAELTYELCKNQSLRADLVRAGKSRVAELSFDRFRGNVEALFGGTRTVAPSRAAPSVG